MATNFPASLDTLTNPTSSDSLSSPSHSAQHANVNDAIEALQAKVGVDSSAVTTSLDYKVAQLEAISHGKILQVVSTTETGTFSASVALGAYSTAAISTTITPSSTASKVLILAQVSVRAPSSAVADAALYRGGSVLTGAIGGAAGSRRRGTSASGAGDGADRLVPTIPIMYLDSPNTTSATTYDVRLGHNQNGTTTVYLNRSDSDPDFGSIARPISSLTLIEVSA
jgi:hypothetical protein